MKSKTENLSTGLTEKIQKEFLGDSDLGDCSSDMRVVLYSHDTMGVGHMRRNLLIANQLKSQFPNASVLAISGAKEACIFAQSTDIDCLTLPSFQKREDGTYTSRSLGIPAKEILEFRRRCILSAVESFQPDLFIVDKVPAGAGGELLPTLEWLSTNSGCHCVLGLRDILDAPEAVIRDWQAVGAYEVIPKYFRSIWIYGDRTVYDAVEEYQFPGELKDRVSYTGYLAASSRLDGRSDVDRDEEPFVLCTIGGGQDGQELPSCFIEAIRATELPSKILTGPYMQESSRASLREAASDLPFLEVIDFVSEGDVLIKQASHVVSMGGYNTLTAILTHQKRALVVPRVSPRQEQFIRANRLAELEYITTLHPNEVSGSAIANWLTAFSDSPPLQSRPLDIQGLQRICNSVGEMFPTAKRRVGTFEELDDA